MVKMNESQRNGRRSAVTIRDVARAANVSIGTVSRVVNGHPTVNPRLREAVEAAMKGLGYRPNAAARTLRIARTGTIGVVVSDLSNPIFHPMVHGISQVATEYDATLLLCDATAFAGAQAAHLRRLHELRVDGVILHPVAEYEEDIAPLEAAGMTVVITGQRHPRGGRPEMVVNEHLASRQAFKYLVDLGHRRIAHVIQGFMPRRLLPTSAQVDRLTAYREVHAEMGLPVDESLVLVAHRPEDAVDRVLAALQRPDPPTAIVSGAHAYTPHVLRAIRSAGLKVPRDLSFITFGDSAWSEANEPPITAIGLDYETYGRRLARLLFSVAAGQPAEVTLHQDSQFLLRESCAPPRPGG
jgi:LacI family transcriptional regulator